jgi:predicted nucleic acid-binding protein
MAVIQVYWDSVCFLGILNKELDKVSKCKGTIEQAENGQLKINTSALTLTEVIKLKGKPRLSRDKEQMIIDFFKHEYMIIHNVDRRIAEHARYLIWKYPALQPKDSIHVATAVIRKIPTLHTFDEDLLALDNKLGAIKLRICQPDIAHQMELGELYEEETDQ